MINTPEPSFLELPDGNKIAYHRFTPTNSSSLPGIIFMGGFKSDMEGSKALFLEDFCKNQGIAYVRFDYFGHGKSSGEFIDGTIGRWKEDVVTVIDQLTEGPQVLIGSSLGGWLMLLAALERPNNLKALIGIAAAPDFTEDLIWDVIKEEEKEIMKNEGVYNLPSEYCDDPDQDPEPYPIAFKLIEEARDHLLLRDKINILCPVKLIHGIEDADVPHMTSFKIAELLESKDVNIISVKDGDHRMSSPESLKVLEDTVKQVLGI